MSLLWICDFLGLFVNTLTADVKHFIRDSDKLRQPIQMKLSKNRKTFSQFFAPFQKYTFNFTFFEKKKMSLIANVFPKLRTAKEVVRQMFQKPHLRTAFDSQQSGPNTSDHHDSIFIIFL